LAITKVEPADIIAEYKYDIYGRRLQKNVNGSTTNFFWEGDNLSFELNQNNQPIRRYIYENGKDDVMAHVEYSEVTDPEYFSPEHKGWYSYIKDQVGTVMKVYKHETKQIVNTRTYDTFGNLINQTGSSTGKLGFQSKYFDQESGLNYYYHRYYYPSIGRFINEDPIGIHGKENLYNFEGSNPINFIDPTGLKFYCNGEWKQVGHTRVFNALCKCHWLCYPCKGEGGVIWSPSTMQSLPSTFGTMQHTGRDIESGDECVCHKPGPEKGCPHCTKYKKGEYYFEKE
jgi:RHS repeat-associated protein